MCLFLFFPKVKYEFSLKVGYRSHACLPKDTMTKTAWGTVAVVMTVEQRAKVQNYA